MIDFLRLLCFKAIIDENIELHKQMTVDDIDIFESKTKEFGHFQFNGLIKIANRLKLDPYFTAEVIKSRIEKNLDSNGIKVCVSFPGFINFKLSSNYISNQLNTVSKFFNLKLGFKNRVVLDYSSPNIAKHMHIGHLRSTIVGECIANLLLFSGDKVIKISHLGDWGMQFGLLIAHLKNVYNSSFFSNFFSLSKLSEFYQVAQNRYKVDVEFAKLAKQEVVFLQKKDKVSLKFWRVITKISKNEYKKIYSLLGVDIRYKGESFYSELLPSLVKCLERKKMIRISEEAKCICLNDMCDQNFDINALIIQKSDGGYNYSTTELASLYYRLKYYKPNKIIYITDVGQKLHFSMIFKLVDILKFKCNNSVELIHIPLGLMLNLDGKKIKTRSGTSEKLLDVLIESIKISKNLILEKHKFINKHKLKFLSETLGINTIKYADLSNKLDQNYIFDKKNAFKSTGNTATFLMYAYVRICSIKRTLRKGGFKFLFNSSDINFSNEAELDLALLLIMYKHFFKSAVNKLDPNILTAYAYRLSVKFHFFFNECTIINSDNFNSRFILCEVTRRVLKSCFSILGLKLVDRM